MDKYHQLKKYEGSRNCKSATPDVNDISVPLRTSGSQFDMVITYHYPAVISGVLTCVDAEADVQGWDILKIVQVACRQTG